MSNLKKIGTLVIVALKARNLAAKEVFGKGDPYATFRVGDKEERIPADKRGGQHPQWDKEVRFDIFEMSSHKKMVVKVYNEDKRDPQLIGDRIVDLSEVLTKGEWDEWHELKYGSKYAGEIFLEMTFYAIDAAGAPLHRKKLPSRPDTKSSPPPASFIPPPISTTSTSAPFVAPNVYPPINNDNSNQYNPLINNSSQYVPPLNINNSNQFPINNNNSNQYVPPLNINNSNQYPLNNSNQLNSIHPINDYNNSNQFAQATNPAAYPPQNIYPPSQNSASLFSPPPIQQQPGLPYPPPLSQGYPPSNNNFTQGGGGYPTVSPPPSTPSSAVSFPIPIPTPTPGIGDPNFANYPYPPPNNLGSGYPPQKQ